MECVYPPIYHYIVNTGCAEGEVRLVGGSNYTQGRVEICMDDVWGTVCDQQWNTVAAGVVCRQLSLASTGSELKFCFAIHLM